MKNSEIHNGLPQKEIRDFLAKGMVESYEADGLNKKDYSAMTKYEDTWERAIALAKAEIKFYEKYIENLMTKQSIIKLIESSGWQEHDVSDDTRNDTGHNMQMNFIGTEDEYKELYNRIYPKEDK